MSVRGVSVRARVRATAVATAVAVALAATLGACSRGPIVAPAHQIEPIMPTIRVAGILTVENGCPLLDDGAGRLLPIWPEGVTVAGDTLRMRDAPVSKVGESLTLGGHWLSRDEVAEALVAPLPAVCAGTGRIFWVQTFELGA